MSDVLNDLKRVQQQAGRHTRPMGDRGGGFLFNPEDYRRLEVQRWNRGMGMMDALRCRTFKGYPILVSAEVPFETAIQVPPRVWQAQQAFDDLDEYVRCVLWWMNKSDD